MSGTCHTEAKTDITHLYASGRRRRSHRTAVECTPPVQELAVARRGLAPEGPRPTQGLSPRKGKT